METIIKNYEMKNAKNGIGHDLAGFQGTLYFKNKKIAVVSDDGWGGDFEFHWVSKDAETEFENFISKEKEIRQKDWMPSNDIEKEVGFLFNGEIFACQLVELFFTIKDYKKQCKNNILFQVGEQIGTDKFYIIKGVKYQIEDEDRLHQLLNKKYDGQKVLILNKELVEV